MSELKVEVVNVDAIDPHPNADRLEIAKIKGWNCVVQKDKFKPNDRAIYFPIDSVLPPTIEEKIFGENSKIKLNHSRVKTIRLRGAISQGLLINPNELGFGNNIAVGDDLTKKLGVTKYEPPSESSPNYNSTIKKNHKKNHPDFHKYTDLQNFKHYPTLFKPEDLVVVTEKIHGSNWRAGWVPYHDGTLWRKFKKLIGMAPKYEFVYGSHNVQLAEGVKKPNSFFDTNIYWEMVQKYDLKNKIPYGYLVYGEVYGDKVQKNYAYGCKKDEHKLVIFDVMLDGEGYLAHHDMTLFLLNNGIDASPVPVLYRGVFDIEKIKQIISGPSRLDNKTKVMEGAVIRPLHQDQCCYIGRKILKLINDEFLLRDHGDNH